MGIYVWGTGCGASELLEQGFALERVEAFVDSFPMGENFLNKPVILPEQMDISACDLLIITARHADAIADRCCQLGIPAEKCLFLKNNTTLMDRNESCSAAKDILGEDLLEKLIPRQRMVPTPSQLNPHSLPEKDLSNDYVRLQLWNCCADGWRRFPVRLRNWVFTGASLPGASISCFRSGSCICLTALRVSVKRHRLRNLSRRPTGILPLTKYWPSCPSRIP